MKFKMNNQEWEIKEISNAEITFLSDEEDVITHGLTEYSTQTIYINKDCIDKRRKLIHELLHCWMDAYGHNQHNKEFNNEDICEIIACSHDIIHEIVERYFKDVSKSSK